ncbi:hypothetical protein PAPYR_1337 [Paratrimastix pyriformis]|uniref:Uncharacterized protein n=1 Tax=Paratrimastix pyriformis TaxID=342808 RepID=A0ABQ8UUP0_9EUKA|nr:hypothetical protein PAPYR_1337 [Paratrimastix pyriformis]
MLESTSGEKLFLRKQLMPIPGLPKSISVTVQEAKGLSVYCVYLPAEYKFQVYDTNLYPLYGYLLSRCPGILGIHLTPHLLLALQDCGGESSRVLVISKMLAWAPQGASLNPQQKSFILEQFEMAQGQRAKGYFKPFPTELLSSAMPHMPAAMQNPTDEQVVLDGFFVYSEDSLYELRPKVRPVTFFRHLLRRPNLFKHSFAESIATTCDMDVFRHFGDIADEFFTKGAHDQAFRLSMLMYRHLSEQLVLVYLHCICSAPTPEIRDALLDELSRSLRHIDLRESPELLGLLSQCRFVRPFLECALSRSQTSAVQHQLRDLLAVPGDLIAVLKLMFAQPEGALQHFTRLLRLLPALDDRALVAVCQACELQPGTPLAKLAADGGDDLQRRCVEMQLASLCLLTHRRRAAGEDGSTLLIEFLSSQRGRYGTAFAVQWCADWGCWDEAALVHFMLREWEPELECRLEGARLRARTGGREALAREAAGVMLPVLSHTQDLPTQASLLMQGLLFWRANELPLGPLEAHLAGRMDLYGPALCQVLLEEATLARIPPPGAPEEAAGQPVPVPGHLLPVPLDVGLLAGAVGQALRRDLEATARVAQSSFAVPSERLWTALTENLAKDPDKRACLLVPNSVLAIAAPPPPPSPARPASSAGGTPAPLPPQERPAQEQAGPAAPQPTASATAPQGDLYVFTCGHSYNGPTFRESLETLHKYIGNICPPTSFGVAVVEAAYRLPTIPLACPRCLYHSLVKLKTGPAAAPTLPPQSQPSLASQLLRPPLLGGPAGAGGGGSLGGLMVGEGRPAGPRAQPSARIHTTGASR